MKKLDPNNISKLWRGGNWSPRQFYLVSPDLSHVIWFAAATPCLMCNAKVQDFFYVTVYHWFDDDPEWDNALGLPIVYNNQSFANMVKDYEGYVLTWDCPDIQVKQYEEKD